MPNLRILGPRSLRGAKNIAKRAGLGMLLHCGEEHWLLRHVVAVIVATLRLASNNGFTL
jgi:hypothetical protein